MFIVFDWDGTLGGKKCKLSKENVEALRILKKLNYEIIIATGRHPNEIKRLLKEFPTFVQYIIGANGGYILDQNNNKMIYKKTIPHNYKNEIINFANEHQTMIGYMDYEDVSFTHFSKERKFMHPFTKKDLLLIDKDHKNRLKNDLGLIGLYIHEDKVLQDKLNNFMVLNNDSLSIIHTDENLIQFMANGIDKWNAIKWLKNHTNKNDIEVIAFGDSYNDYQMIKNANIGVAMGNANKDILGIADVIIGDSEGPSILKFVTNLKK